MEVRLMLWDWRDEIDALRLMHWDCCIEIDALRLMRGDWCIELRLLHWDWCMQVDALGGERREAWEEDGTACSQNENPHIEEWWG